MKYYKMLYARKGYGFDKIRTEGYFAVSSKKQVCDILYNEIVHKQWFVCIVSCNKKKGTFRYKDINGNIHTVSDYVNHDTESWYLVQVSKKEYENS